MGSLLRTFLALALLTVLSESRDVYEYRMPSIYPQEEAYVCTSLNVNKETNIVGFEALNEHHNAHHILIFGCEEPGLQEEIWDCGEMNGGAPSGLQFASPCAAKPTILYAWAHNAPKLQLPKDVGMRVGGGSAIKSIVMQVHYMRDSEELDTSGVAIEFTEEQLPKQAGAMLLVTGGSILPHSVESFETACTIDEDVQLHPFAYRTHTHSHGADVSGWVITEKDGSDSWNLIGRRDPQLPQMFVAVENKTLTISKGDIVGARCVMVNEEEETIRVGGRGVDEMCNMYVLYWTQGKLLNDSTCFSPGAPDYYWSTDARLTNIPQ